MASKSFDLEQIKKKTADLSKSWQKKLGYLSEQVSRSGMEGASHWLKSHHQIDELNAAIDELLEASNSESFKLIQVDTTLNSFVIPEEDQGQADWYRAASNLIDGFEKSLIEDQEFDAKKLTALLNELKFISEADDFHHRYKIQSIQQKVTKVYQTLLQALTEYKTLQREKLDAQKEQDKLKAAQIEADKAAAEAKKAMMETVKIKEKRLAIIEEKKRKLAEKELLESQNRHEIEQSEMLAKQAEIERQSKLQDAYIDLQLEEKINNWQAIEIAELLQKKADSSALSDEIQSKISAVIAALSHDD